MTREQLAHEIALGLVATGVEGDYATITCSTAGDYPSFGISQWEGSRGDNLLIKLNLPQYVGLSYSYLNSINKLNYISDVLNSDRGRQVQLEQLTTDCLVYVDTLSKVPNFTNPICIIYAGIWCPTSHLVVSKFLTNKVNRKYDINDIEVITDIFAYDYADYACIPYSCYLGYYNRAINTYDYIINLDLSTTTSSNEKAGVVMATEFKCFLNPGHSIDEPSVYNEYPDHGTSSPYTGEEEGFVALEITNLVNKYLTNAGVTTKVFQYDGLRAISNASNNWDPDIFVSIHCNSAGSPSARGTETFCYYNSIEGRKLAQCIHKRIIEKVFTQEYIDKVYEETGVDIDRGVKENNFHVLRETNCTAVLIETAFMSNEQDSIILRDKKDEFARAIAIGITDYQLLYLNK